MIEPVRDEGAAPQRVINLMDALRASIGAETKKKPAAPSTKARAGPAPRQEEGGTLTRQAHPDREVLEGTVAFTGRLASMKRADAFAQVRQHGGKPRESVTKQTDILIVGEFGWPLLDDGRPSNALTLAKSYRHAGRQRAAVSRMAWATAPRGAGQHLCGGPARLLEQAAARHGRPARDVRTDRSARRPLRVSRSCGRPPGGGIARRRHAAVGHHQEPVTRSASGCRMHACRTCSLFPESVRPHFGRADARADRQYRPVCPRCRQTRRRSDAAFDEAQAAEADGDFARPSGSIAAP